MNASDFRDAGRLITIITAALIILFLVGGGIGVGCSKFIVYKSQNSAKAQKAGAKKAFYSLCRNKLRVGQIDDRCPR